MYVCGCVGNLLSIQKNIPHISILNTDRLLFSSLVFANEKAKKWNKPAFQKCLKGFALISGFAKEKEYSA